MQKGDFVVYVDDPLWLGRMVIVSVLADGRLLCEAVHTDREDGTYPRNVFTPMELEIAAIWEKQAA